MAKRFRPVKKDSYVSSPFGPRAGGYHRGTDFGLKGGSGNMPVYAAQGGRVVYTGPASGFGGPDPAGWVVVDHSTADGSGTTVYGHVIREVSVGQRVEAGQRIARVNPSSATNGGTAPHLHFEVHPTVWRQGSQIDPIKWLGNAPSVGEPSPAPAKPAPAQPPAPAGVIFGVDVSNWQNGMSLKRAKAEGMQFAILRTTDGTYRDKVYRSHFEDARSAGLVIMSYHYLRNPSEGTTVAQQVKASLEVMGNYRAPIWLDCETPAGLHIKHIREAKRLYEAAGVRVLGVYSYVPYWERQVAPSEPDTHTLGALWVAAYGANRHGSPTQLYPGNSHKQWNYPLGNQRPLIWQYGSNALVAGFSVDINAYRGTRAELEAFVSGKAAGSKPELETPPTPAPDLGYPVDPNPGTGQTRPVEDAPPAPERTPEPPATTPAPDDKLGPSRPRRTVLDLILDTFVNFIVGKRP